MIVEFFGIPGGGKTRLLRQLVATLPNASESLVTSRHAIARAVLYFALRHPLSFFVWMSELAFHARGLFRYKLGLLLRAMAALAQAERIDDTHLTFVDEGLLQRILTVFDKPLSSRHIKFLLTMTPLSDVVVVVRGGEFGRFTVESDRQNSPRVNRGEQQLQEWMQNVRTNARVVESVLSEYIDVVVCTRGESDADPAKILRYIEEYRENHHDVI